LSRQSAAHTTPPVRFRHPVRTGGPGAPAASIREWRTACVIVRALVIPYAGQGWDLEICRRCGRRGRRPDLGPAASRARADAPHRAAAIVVVGGPGPRLPGGRRTRDHRAPPFLRELGAVFRL